MSSNSVAPIHNDDHYDIVEDQLGFRLDSIPSSTKWSFVTRNVDVDDVKNIAMLPDRVPQSGDLVLASVSKISQHTRIQLRSGRRSLLYPDDKVIVAFGNRYAPDQFESVVPSNLDSCHLVAAGGIASKANAKHSSLKWPTTLKPEGYCLGKDGQVLNLSQYSVTSDSPATSQPLPVVAVLGTSMNSGKTTAAAALVKGLSSAGFNVAAIKATGTGAGNDLWAYADSGAYLILDFTDAGHPSTYKVPQSEIQACFENLLKAADDNPHIDITVVEIAGGLLHGETSALVASDYYSQRVGTTLFAAGEAMGAMAGVDRLARLGVRPAALTGLMSASQLASIEAERETDIPVITKSQLQSANVPSLLGL